MVSRKVVYKAKNKQEGLSINAEIVYPVDEQDIIPMSEIGGGLYKTTVSLNDNTTYVIKVEKEYKLYEIGDITLGQSGSSFIRIRNTSDIDIFVYNIVNGVEIGVWLKYQEEVAITLNAYRLQMNDEVFKNYVEIVG